MSTQFDKLEKCYEYCKTVTDFIPRVGLILGSGLGGYAKNMKVVKEISYDQIPGFPVSTVQGHDGKFLLGYIGKVPAMDAFIFMKDIRLRRLFFRCVL